MRKVPYHLQEKPSPASYLAKYKALAGAIADRIAAGDVAAAVSMTLDGRRTKGVRAALLAGLVVGACCDRGDEMADAASTYLASIATRIDR